MQSRTAIPDQAVADAAIDHAVRCWTVFARERGFQARLSGWESGAAADGRPLVSAQLVGPDGVDALMRFVSVPEHWRPLAADDLRPAFDYSVPGRVVCVWRAAGVWVEVWHPEPAPAPPAPAQAPSRASADASRRLLGARLPFTRGSGQHPEAAARGTGAAGNPAP